MRRYESILREIQTIYENAGEMPSHKVVVSAVEQYTPDEIKQVRQAAGMTQWMFAQVIGVTAKSVEGWEGGRSHPDGAARRMIGLLKANPRFADEAGIVVR